MYVLYESGFELQARRGILDGITLAHPALCYRPLAPPTQEWKSIGQRTNTYTTSIHNG